MGDLDGGKHNSPFCKICARARLSKSTELSAAISVSKSPIREISSRKDTLNSLDCILFWHIFYSAIHAITFIHVRGITAYEQQKPQGFYTGLVVN